MPPIVSLIFLAVFCHQSLGYSFTRTMKLCLKAGIYNDATHQPFLKFIIRYRKIYQTSEECTNRFKSFIKSSLFIKRLQATEKGTAVYGVTKWSDISNKELKVKHNSKPEKYKGARVRVVSSSLPERWDWREKNAVTRVVNQGMCNSCYAFAAVANAEGVYAVQKNVLKKFSEQQIVDCDSRNFGCELGSTFNASLYTLEYGLMKASAYKYQGETEECKYDESRAKYKPTSFEVLSADEAAIAMYLVENGPISAYVNMNCIKNYKHGIIFNRDAPKTGLYHAVTLVGYGAEVGESGVAIPYWIVKNSWGKKHGEKGFFRIGRNEGLCDINRFVYSVRFDST